MTESTARLLLVAADAEAQRRFHELSGDAGGPTWEIVVVDDTDVASRRLDTASFDAVVLPAAIADARCLARIRRAGSDAAVVVLREDVADDVPLDPQDVGIQSTLDLWTLDARTLALTVQLAIERHRLTLEQARTRRQAEQLAAVASSRDPLTGLPVGEPLLQAADRVLADAIRFGRPLTVGLLEVHGLDGVRGAHGDGVGDGVMIHVTGLLVACLRTSDLLGRLGGDQLLVAMPGTDATSAMHAARRIQDALQARPCTVGEVVRSLEVTVGLAALSGLMAVDELVFRADAALATARTKGPSGLHLMPEPAVH
ncbi:GGDEF domain-containing protein [Euzebya rosea]|uniref:GGDEF domain-containing protein n=1 Tax=Euzebya rosea TaxID=2052804 RepID=UPI0013005F62|nr:GGDEF domain-containing protein [Euzebya rosea]